MSQQIINIGQSANDRSGDPLRTAFTKVNANFTELYNSIGLGGSSDRLINGSNSVILETTGDLTISGNITSTVSFGIESAVGGNTSGVFISADTTSPGANGNTFLYSTNNAIIRTNNNGVPKDWTFDADGQVSLPGFIEFLDSSIQETAYRYSASTTAPVLTTGALWFNTTEGRLYINYNNAWVDANPTEIDASALRFDTSGYVELPVGGTISYTPGTPADWAGTPPTTMQEALDRLAYAVKAINSTGA